MKPRCPRCCTLDVFRLGDGSFGCEQGHAFSACDALISVGEAVTLAKALDHPTRRAILFAFGEQDEWSALELTRHLKVETPHHVKVLRETAPPIIVESKREPRRGATEVWYCMNPRLLDGPRRPRKKGKRRPD